MGKRKVGAATADLLWTAGKPGEPLALWGSFGSDLMSFAVVLERRRETMSVHRDPHFYVAVPE
jgi:hypothetical protein